MGTAQFTARVVVTVDTPKGLSVITIRDLDKKDRPGGDFLAFPGGGRKFDEFPFQTGARELCEETGLDKDRAVSTLIELGVIHLTSSGGPPHDVYFYSQKYPYEYVRETLAAIADGIQSKLEKRIECTLERAPLDPREFLGSHYAHLAQLAPDLHKQIFG